MASGAFGATVRRSVRRALPYVLVGIGGFTLAYLIVSLVLLPAGPDIPSAPTQPTTDSLLSVKAEPDTQALSGDSAGMPLVAEPSTDLVEIPDVVGMELEDANTIINSYHLTVVVRRDTSSIRPPDTVLRQSPAPGDSVPANSPVMLTVSQFPPLPTP